MQLRNTFVSLYRFLCASLLLTYAPPVAGLDTALIVLINGGPGTARRDVRVTGVAIQGARIVVVPDSFFFSLPPTGDTARAILRIYNVGAETLRYQITEEPRARSAGLSGDQSPESLPCRGGPDPGGYYYIDSNEPGGPQFEWVDIRSNGTFLLLGDDQIVGPFPIGFSFPFYGSTYDSVRVCSDGWVSFMATSSLNPVCALRIYWADLNPSAGGTVHYLRDFGHQRFIVQYTNVPSYGGAGSYTFQAIIKPSGGIMYQYLRMVNPTFAIVGIASCTAASGFSYACPIQDSLAILFTRDLVPWLSTDRTSGVISPLDSQNVRISVCPTGLASATHRAALRITTNVADTVDVPVRLDVVVGFGTREKQLPTAFSLEQNYPNPFNPTTTIQYALPKEANVTLRIYNVLGQEVAALVNETEKAAYYELRWDGKNRDGASLSSGVYFVRIDAVPLDGSSAFSEVRKIMMLK